MLAVRLITNPINKRSKLIDNSSSSFIVAARELSIRIIQALENRKLLSLIMHSHFLSGKSQSVVCEILSLNWIYYDSICSALRCSLPSRLLESEA